MLEKFKSVCEKYYNKIENVFEYLVLFILFTSIFGFKVSIPASVSILLVFSNKENKITASSVISIIAGIIAIYNILNMYNLNTYIDIIKLIWWKILIIELISFIINSVKDKLSNIKYLILPISCVITILSAAIIFNGFKYVNNINPVRLGYFSSYSNTVTIGDAFENYFDNPNWSCYNEDGDDIVKFTGECIMHGEMSTVSIKFIVYDNSFEAYDMSINNKSCSILLQSMIAEIYGYY